MDIQFTIIGPIPSKKNSLRRIMRGGRIFTVPSSAHERWHDIAFLHLKKQLRGLRAFLPVLKCKDVEIDFRMADSRSRDLTNSAESVMDLLVDCGVLLDDCWQVTGPVLLRPLGIDRDNPVAEVKISFNNENPGS